MGCCLACFRNNDNEIVVESSGQEPPVVVASVGDAHKKVGREQVQLTVSGDRNSDKIKTIKQGSGESKFSKVSVKAKHDEVISMIKDKVKAETAARNDVGVLPTNSNAYNKFETVHEDGDAISKSDVEIITSEAQTKKEENHSENENQLRNELFGNSMSQKNEVAGDDDDDMPVLRPLQPQFSEILRCSVLVREPDDLSVTQEVDSTVPCTTGTDKEFGADGNVI